MSDVFGSNIQIEYSDESNEIELFIDLSGNLRTRNKQTNTYLDTKELESSWEQIESFKCLGLAA